jgi:hypothetical protein
VQPRCPWRLSCHSSAWIVVVVGVAPPSLAVYTVSSLIHILYPRLYYHLPFLVSVAQSLACIPYATQSH